VAPEWRIEALEKAHERVTFACGDERSSAICESKPVPTVHGARRRRMSSCGRTSGAWAYYTLSSSSIDLHALPESERRRLPRRVPAVLIGRFAVDSAVQGQGLGRLLLQDAFERIRLTAETVGIYGVEVDAIDAWARASYVARDHDGQVGGRATGHRAGHRFARRLPAWHPGLRAGGRAASDRDEPRAAGPPSRRGPHVCVKTGWHGADSAPGAALGAAGPRSGGAWHVRGASCLTGSAVRVRRRDGALRRSISAPVVEEHADHALYEVVRAS
jgi:GNAT superfamily N-acetyltransferase